MEVLMSKRYVVPYTGKGSTFGEEEIQAVAALLRTDETLSCGHEREAFEAEFAEFVGVRHAVSVTNCTVALELATHLIGLEPGDEVIAAPLSYQATVSPLLSLPVKVSFCDIDPNSLAPDLMKLHSLVTPRTRAIYLTHYGGLMADMDAIMDIAQDHNLIIVEDCAHAHGSEYKGRKAGAAGHIGCFSFQSLKNMSSLGEGGMITLNDDGWATVLRRIRGNEPDAVFVARPELCHFGKHSSPTRNLNRHAKNAYTHDCIALRHAGTNATLSEPAAAVGRVQLRKLRGFVDRRRQIAHRLNVTLRQIPGIRVQEEPADYLHTYHLYTLFIDPSSGLNREIFGAALDDAGVEVHLRYFPLHLLPEWRFKGGKYGDCPVAERVWFEELINLPIYPSLSDEQIDYMTAAISHTVDKTREDVKSRDKAAPTTSCHHFGPNLGS